MDNRSINIAILEPSQIVFEGLSGIITRLGRKITITRISGLTEFLALARAKEINIAIINPSLLQNRLSEFIKAKRELKGILWLSLVYNLYSNDLLENFDDTVSIDDSVERIASKILDQNASEVSDSTQETLSLREMDVLREMIRGLSNKEIADALNISIHTVISHRRNITDKTGIKSLPGLTIYAISKRLVPISSFNGTLR